MTARSILHDFLRFTLRPPVRILWLESVHGIENVPPAGPVIIASNHESYLDFIALDAALTRPPIFLAGEVFYQKPLIKWAFDRMRFIRVDRDQPGGAEPVISAARNALSDGQIVALYPEGTRSTDGKLHKAHSGVGLLAHLSEVPVIPVGVSGTFEAWPKGSPRPRFEPCHVHFGEPMRFFRADYDTDVNVVRRSTSQIMRRIAELTGEEYPW